MAQLAEVARAVRDLIADIGLTTFPLTSGSKGLHLYSPLDEPVSSRGAVVLAKRVAQQLEKSMPKLVTVDHDQEPAGRQGVRGLEPEQRLEDHHRAVFAARTRASDRRRAAQLGGTRRPRSCGQLRYDEVLAAGRARRRPAGAAGRRRAASPDRLTKYRSMRDAAKTPEPVPKYETGMTGQGNTFVIQEHHARRLHYDFRLERDGVLVSWAVPKNLPETTVGQSPGRAHRGPSAGVRQLRGQHPEGGVRRRQGGHLGLRHLRDREVQRRRKRRSHRHAARQPNLRALRADSDQRQSVAGASDEGPEGLRNSTSSPRCWPPKVRWRSSRRRSGRSRASGTATGCWSTPTTARCGCGRAAAAMSPRNIPQLRSLAADLADHHVVLDGEVVALDESGVPSFNEMQNRARATRIEFWAFDLLYLDGRSLLRARYRDRRQAAGNPGRRRQSDRSRSAARRRRAGARLLAQARWEGVIAKKRDSTYQPGRRSASWIKDKYWNTQEVVIGGWRAGEGGRTSGIGSLLMGIPGDGRTAFRRAGRHRVHRTRPGQAEEDAGAAAHRRIPFRRSASRPRRQGRDVRASRCWSEKSATANGPRMTGCANPVGAGCDPTRNQVRW